MFRTRILIFASFFLITGFVILTRLVELQLLNGGGWRDEAETLATRERSIPFRRGSIVDRTGRVIAYDEETYAIDFEYRSFKLKNPIAQAAHAWLLLQNSTGASDIMPTLVRVAKNPSAAAAILMNATPAAIAGAGSSNERETLRLYYEKLLDFDRLANRPLRSQFRDAIRRKILIPIYELFPGPAGAVSVKISAASQQFAELDSRLGRENGETLQQIENIRNDIIADVEAAIANIYERGEPIPAGEVSIERARRRRSREAWLERFADDVSYPAVELLTFRAELYAGFSAVESTARRYADPILPWVVGTVRKRTAEEIQRSRDAQARLELLSRQLERSDAEELEYERLREIVAKTQYPAGDLIGADGVEAWFESDLHGERGFVYEVFGRRGSEMDKSEIRAPRHGLDVKLTIDLQIQRFAEELLRGGVPALPGPSSRGAFVVIDVHNGDVLALAATPDFSRDDLKDKNRFASLQLIDGDPKNPHHPLHHRAYRPWHPPAPGSAFKIVTALAALEKGIITQDTTNRCDGKIGRLRCDGVHKEIALREAIEQSCNCYFGWLGEKLGLAGLDEYAKKMGFIQKTGFHPAEVRGGFGIDYADIDMLRRCGVGYQIDSTPLQVARSYAAIANGGKIIKLRAVREVNGKVIPTEIIDNLNISDETLQFLRASLRDVVAGTKGTARSSGLAELSVAGKTGTAEIDSIKDLNHAWFAGYAPFDNPKIAFAVYLEKVPLHGKEVTPLVRALLESDAIKNYISAR
ncbi:MAG: peptidoglycan D,D-transpeptidase FtsI family protein [Planctomycetota bacterium]